MAENSKIEWTTHTFNPWRGCVKVAAGCANCYADAQAKRNPGTLGIWGADGTRVVASETKWREPFKWNGSAGSDRTRVFCASMADVFEDWQGHVRAANGELLWQSGDTRIPWDVAEQSYRAAITMNDVRQRLFATIDNTPNLDWLLLTKRPENVRYVWNSVDERPAGNLHKHRQNVWLGTSIAMQEDADRNIPKLLKCRDLAPVLFLSIEPMLGPVNIARFLESSDGFCLRDNVDGNDPIHRGDGGRGINWVIVGGESGHNARPCDIVWIRSIVKQCESVGVPCFVKQLGANVRDSSRPVSNEREFWKLATKDKKGGDWNEWPEDLRVREFPTVQSSPC